MAVDRRFVIAVALLAFLAVTFGLVGTFAPPLADEAGLAPNQETSSSSDSLAHFTNPPTYDSAWVDIRTKTGQYFDLKHGLNTTEVVVDITGKESISPEWGALIWNTTFGETDEDCLFSMIQTSDGGYALAGYTYSSGAGDADFWLVKTDASGNKLWNKTYGGTETDRASSLVQTSDGGYAIAGTTNSYGAGSADFWLVKTDSGGNAQWNRTHGTELGSESADEVIQTSDGGYAVVGEKCPPGTGVGDFWLVKTDSAGNMQWNRTYDNSGRDDWPAAGIVQTSDGGYAVAGHSGSFLTSDVFDLWLVKTDADGSVEWDKTYERTTWDFAYDVIQTSDGGYALTGGTRCESGPMNQAVLLLKTDQDGNMSWHNTYGGRIHDHAFSVVQTDDGGYAMAGFSSTNATNVYTYTDLLLVRTDSVGNMLWKATCGESSTADRARSIVQTSDGEYVLAGYTNSYGSGNYDGWLVKTEEIFPEHKRYLGGTNLIPGWTGTFGGAGSEAARSAVQTADGGYALAGYNSTAGNVDFCLVKTDAAGRMQWSKNYGTPTGDEGASSVIQTADGGYAMAGINSSGNANFCLVKANSAGVMQWSKNYGGAGYEEAYSLVETVDGGYALAGYNNTGGSYYFCLVKTDSAGSMQWSKNYGIPTGDKVACSLVQTVDCGYAMAGYNYSAGSYDFCLVKAYDTGVMAWSRNYGGTGLEIACSLVITADGGYALAGYNNTAGNYDFCLAKTDSAGLLQWSKNYGGTDNENARSIVQASDDGYALAGCTYSLGAGDFWLVKTDTAGNMQWNRSYGGAAFDLAYSLVQTVDGGYALAGSTNSFGVGGDLWLVKTDIETGLALTDMTGRIVTFYRGGTDLYWNYVRVRIWTIKEPSWIYGDINMDGVVDAQDLYILSRNYGQTFSLLSLTGIVAVAGVHTYRTRKQPKTSSKRPHQQNPEKRFGKPSKKRKQNKLTRYTT